MMKRKKYRTTFTTHMNTKTSEGVLVCNDLFLRMYRTYSWLGRALNNTQRCKDDMYEDTIYKRGGVVCVLIAHELKRQEARL